MVGSSFVVCFCALIILFFHFREKWNQKQLYFAAQIVERCIDRKVRCADIGEYMEVRYINVTCVTMYTTELMYTSAI